MQRRYRSTCAGGLIALLIVFFGHSLVAEETPVVDIGDVYVAVGNGAYKVYNSNGEFKTTISDGLGGFTTDCGFSPTSKTLFTTNYTHSKVVMFDQAPKYEVSNVVNTGDTSPRGHSGSIVFDATGNFYVGHPDGNALIHKYDLQGFLLSTYETATGSRGTASIDLAADQMTLFYTSEGRSIFRYATASGTQLSAFAELPGSGTAYALRLLSPGTAAAACWWPMV